MIARKKPLIRSLVDGARRPGCVAAGCGNQPETDKIICREHSMALYGLAPAATPKEESVRYCVRCGDLTSTRLCGRCQEADRLAEEAEAQQDGGSANMPTQPEAAA